VWQHLVVSAPTPPSEELRLRLLRKYTVLDSAREQVYDDIVLAAAVVMNTPIALVSLVDEHRQWFKARLGLAAEETPRELAFCAHAILKPNEVMVVQDALKDARFSTNPLVLEQPKIRFYCGIPLVTPEREAMGTLCTIDTVPRPPPTPEQEAALRSLSRLVVHQMENSKLLRELRDITEAATASPAESIRQVTERLKEQNRRWQALLAKEQLKKNALDAEALKPD
jgi:GAF domain-containing protein